MRTFHVFISSRSQFHHKRWKNGATSLSHGWQEIARSVNAPQFPKHQPNPCTWESFQEATKALVFGEKAEALSSHTSPYIRPLLAHERSAAFVARIWDFRSGREELYPFHILQEWGRLKAHPLNPQLAFLSAERRVRKHEACSVPNGFKSTLYKDCLI